MKVKMRGNCDCSRPATHGYGQYACCDFCWSVEQWLVEEHLRFTNRLTEEQREKAYEREKEDNLNKRYFCHRELGRLVRPEEPVPAPPPNTLFHIRGFKDYFLIDRHTVCDKT